MKVVDAWTAASLVVREQKEKVDWSKFFFWNDITHVPPPFAVAPRSIPIS